jgi:hypothetical protein
MNVQTLFKQLSTWALILIPISVVAFIFIPIIFYHFSNALYWDGLIMLAIPIIATLLLPPTSKRNSARVLAIYVVLLLIVELVSWRLVDVKQATNGGVASAYQENALYRFVGPIQYVFMLGLLLISRSTKINKVFQKAALLVIGLTAMFGARWFLVDSKPGILLVIAYWVVFGLLCAYIYKRAYNKYASIIMTISTIIVAHVLFVLIF